MVTVGLVTVTSEPARYVEFVTERDYSVCVCVCVCVWNIVCKSVMTNIVMMRNF